MDTVSDLPERMELDSQIPSIQIFIRNKWNYLCSGEENVQIEVLADYAC
jgi:hypothetical protein